MTQVLDKGFIRLEDYMGSDLMVANAARVSMKKRVNEFVFKGTPEDKERFSTTGMGSDEGLLNYMAKHSHWTPFAHPTVCVHIKFPIFVARQWMRSNVGIVYNEVSRRYVSDLPEFYEPEVWRGKPKNAKQGSDGVVDYVPAREYATGPAYADDVAKGEYEIRLDEGVCPEQARMCLPQSTYTEVWMTASLYAMSRVYRQRIDSHAQWEIQQYAKALDKIMRPLFPVAWAALTKSVAEVPEE